MARLPRAVYRKWARKPPIFSRGMNGLRLGCLLACFLCGRLILEYLFLCRRGNSLLPTRLRSADDPPKRTPSFVCEVPLRVRPREERTLLARLEAARQVYNACLG